MIWSKAGKMDMACEALHSLGEVSMEGHNYEQAITDFEDCLSKRTAVLPAGSRSIAETYYWHGVALAHVDNWTGAEAALNHALDVIDIRINTIEMMEPSEHMTQEKEDLEEEEHRLGNYEVMEQIYKYIPEARQGKAHLDHVIDLCGTPKEGGTGLQNLRECIQWTEE